MSELGYQLSAIATLLKSPATPPEALRVAYVRLLELTESLGAHLATTGLPAPWDDPIWPEGSEVPPIAKVGER